MDAYLEKHDLGAEFARRGVVAAGVTKKINLDLPEPIIQEIDEVADRVGVARQPLLKMWIYQMLKTEKKAA